MRAYIQFVLTDLAYKYGRPLAAWALERVFDVANWIPLTSTGSIDLLTTAHRFQPSPKRLRKLKQNRDDLLGQLDIFVTSKRTAEAVLDRTLVLKNPEWHQNQIEKGVLLIKFTETFKDVFMLLDCAALEEYFWIVLEPSWSGYALPEIHCWMSLKSPILIESSELKDFDYIESLESNLMPVRFGSSDWVDERIFHPISGEGNAKFDSIYIANFNRMKRHHVYLRALAKINDSNYQAALVCGSWGAYKNEVFSMVKYFGLEDVVECFVQLPQRDLNKLLNHSRLNVLMSLKEGSNRTIFEGFFANTPGLVLAENVGVNKNYINDDTGYLIEERELARTLLEDRYRSAARFRPREWAMENISAHQTTGKLNQHLSELAKQSGEPWTKDAVVKVNAPEAVYYDPDFALTLWNGQKLIDLFERGKVDAGRIERQL